MRAKSSMPCLVLMGPHEFWGFGKEWTILAEQLRLQVLSYGVFCFIGDSYYGRGDVTPVKSYHGYILKTSGSETMMPRLVASVFDACYAIFPRLGRVATKWRAKDGQEEYDPGPVPRLAMTQKELLLAGDEPTGEDETFATGHCREVESKPAGESSA